jgi:hypothetical protein
MPPSWITEVAHVWLIAAAICAAAIGIIELVRPPKMPIMAAVWPITALYMGPFAVWAYFKIERGSALSSAEEIFYSTTHCGAGCTLGDIIGELCVFYAGWTLITRLGAEYAADFVLAYAFGILFQYFAIAPMRGLGFRDGLTAAIKADTLSLIAFEIGLFGWMALSSYVLFPHVDMMDPVYWFMMQVGMVVGFFTSWPMNAALLRAGIKEPM